MVARPRTKSSPFDPKRRPPLAQDLARLVDLDIVARLLLAHRDLGTEADFFHERFLPQAGRLPNARCQNRSAGTQNHWHALAYFISLKACFVKRLALAGGFEPVDRPMAKDEV